MMDDSNDTKIEGYTLFKGICQDLLRQLSNCKHF